MATIAENLQTIQNIKQDIKTAIENKGVDMTNTPFSEYSTKIDEITTGGGSDKIDVAATGLKFGYSTLTEIPDVLDFSNVTDMSNMFRSCDNITTIQPIDTSNAINMYYMFGFCSSLKTIPLIDTSNVKYMESMFYNCTSLTTLPLLNTGNATRMDYMFYYCNKLTTLPQLNTANVTDMSNMFYNCSLLQSIPQFDTTKVTNMKYMFYGCTKLQSLPLLNTGNATRMDYMFYNCSSLQSIPQFDTTKVTNMDYMFYGCTKLQSLPLLDCGKITSINSFFGHSVNSTLTDLGGFKDLKISLGFGVLNVCPNLTVESLMNVINNAYDLTTNGLSGQSLKFGQTNLDKLTAEQIAVATAKGWTLTA